MKCSRCKKEHGDEMFIGNKGQVMKMCQTCRDYCKKYKLLNKCVHNRQKSRCKDCGGSQICIHNRRKSTCKDCGGASICIHNRIKSTCKLCSDAEKITIKNMINRSKESDKNKDRYDADNFIDHCFIEQLMYESMECYHCQVEMQITEYRDDLCTIERLDNSIGHIKSNCVLACRKCNLSKIGQR